MINEEIFNNEAFKNIEPKKLETIKRIVKEADGKTSEQALNIFLDNMPSLSHGKPLTPNERNAVIIAITSNMDDVERKKFDQIMHVIQMMKR